MSDKPTNDTTTAAKAAPLIEPKEQPKSLDEKISGLDTASMPLPETKASEVNKTEDKAEVKEEPKPVMEEKKVEEKPVEETSEEEASKKTVRAFVFGLLIGAILMSIMI